MRTIFTSFLLLYTALQVSAQPEIIDKAIISTKTSVSIIDKDAEPAPQPVFDRWGNAITILRPDDEKTFLSISYFKNGKLKTEAKIVDSIIVHSLRDYNAQTTTAITQFKKTVYYYQNQVVPQGQQQDTIIPIIHLSRPTLEKFERSIWGLPIYITDAALAQMQKAIDSTKLANGYDTAQQNPSTNIVYQDVDKKIAGYHCKRAVIVVRYPNGEAEQLYVWYNTEIKINGLEATGDPAFAHGYLNPTKKWAFLSGLKGFPMEFEMKLAPNRNITVTVNKLDIKRKIVDKEIAIPNQTPPVAFETAPQDNHLKNPGMQYSMTYSNGQLLPITVVTRD